MSTNAPAVPRADPTTGPQARTPSWFGAVSAVCAGQLARTRVVRVPLLFVAAFQSIGILVLLRVVGGKGSESAQIVSGATILVVAFIGLNLLAQRFGALKGNGGLDYYAALPVPASAVVLGTAASYATFAVPGCVVTMVAGIAMYGLGWAPLILLAPVLLLAGASLAGVGAALGLLAPRPEIATVLGQLGMSAVIFLDLVPAHRLVAPVQVVRAIVPSTYAADALSEAFAARPDAWLIARDLGVCAAVAAAALVLAGWAFGKAVRR